MSGTSLTLLIGLIAAARVAIADSSTLSDKRAAAPLAQPATQDLARFDDIVAAVTNPQNLVIAPSAVPKAFQPFGPFKQDEFLPGAMLIDGERKPWGILEVNYKQDEKAIWRLEDVSFYLPDHANDTSAFTTLFDALRTKLGKPFRTKKEKGRLSAAAWKLSKTQRVWLLHKADSLPNDQQIQQMTILSAGKETEAFED
jgi:hypothetical protein